MHNPTSSCRADEDSCWSPVSLYLKVPKSKDNLQSDRFSISFSCFQLSINREKNKGILPCALAEGQIERILTL